MDVLRSGAAGVRPRRAQRGQACGSCRTGPRSVRAASAREQAQKTKLHEIERTGAAGSCCHLLLAALRRRRLGVSPRLEPRLPAPLIVQPNAVRPEHHGGYVLLCAAHDGLRAQQCAISQCVTSVGTRRRRPCGTLQRRAQTSQAQSEQGSLSCFFGRAAGAAAAAQRQMARGSARPRVAARNCAPPTRACTRVHAHARDAAAVHAHDHLVLPRVAAAAVTRRTHSAALAATAAARRPAAPKRCRARSPTGTCARAPV